MPKHEKKKKQLSQTAEMQTETQLVQTPKLSQNSMKFIIALLAVLLYGYTISFDFTLDDTLMITSNDLTKQGISGIPDIFTNDAFVGFFGKEKDLVAGGRYRPLTHAMFALEYELFGPSPLFGHMMNIILYALLGLIVFRTLTLCMNKSSEKNHWIAYIPFTATLLFIAHPLHTEVVANIKGRDEIISMGGSMLLLFYSFKYINTQKLKYLIFSFLSMLIALFSKENSITFLAVVPLTIYFFNRAAIRDYAKMMIPLVMASLIFILARYNALGFWLTGGEIQTEILNNPFVHSTKSEEIATVLYTWLIYFKLLIFPHPLTHDYYPWHLNVLSFSDAIVWLSVAVVLTIAVIAIILFKRKHMISYGILFFAFTFSIQSNLFFNIGAFMNERFVFVALLGFCIIIAWMFSELMKRNIKYLHLIFIILIILYSGKTIARSMAWKDNYTLFTTDVNISVNSAKCNVSAAESILKKAEQEPDQQKAEQMFHQAWEYLQHAQQIHPTYFGAYDLGGKAAFHLGLYNTAFQNYQMCLTINPDAPLPVENIYLVAVAATQKGLYNESIEMLTWLTGFAPDSLRYILELGNVYEKAGNIDEALRVIHALADEHPGHYQSWSKLGEIYGKHLNNLQKSEKYLLKAHELNPAELSVNENLGIVYGMQGKFEKSIEFFSKALEADSTVTRLHTNIGNTYMMMNEQQKAAYHFEKAGKLENKGK